ncbi:unnamed protein product [Brachionus calyciflorus]|uniref:Uncharacterized protein n=1 Tax=Brachionus calyciflorus TaxID=104777 RepID=A0A813V5I1_9BILA|nr:unnamed protein product [Brachionus calyciflorus]
MDSGFFDKKKTNIGLLENETDLLVQDIKSIFEKLKQWLIDFNEEKCVVMHYGSSNKNYEYFLNNHKLTESNQEKDLAVVYTKDLKNSAHIAIAARKANYALSVIKRSFKYCNIYTIKKLYTSLVRPHLEYAVQVWNPFLKQEINIFMKEFKEEPPVMEKSNLDWIRMSFLREYCLFCK